MSLLKRRGHELRMKAKAKRIAKQFSIDGNPSDVAIGKTYSTHGKSCSCAMCGNPRKHQNEKTLKEKSEDQTWDNDFLDHDPHYW